MRPTPDKMRAFMAQLRKKMNFKSLVVTLAAIVVFTTTYLLILPAFTLDKDEAVEQGGIDVAVEQTVETADEEAPAEQAEEPAAEQKESADAVTEAEEPTAKEEVKEEVKEETASPKQEDSDVKEEKKEDKEEVKLLSKKKELTAEKEKTDNFTISAVVDKDAKVPEDVFLQATELTKDIEDFDYNSYYKDSLKALKKDSSVVKGIKTIKFYDISLEAESQDESVEPKAAVNVKIAYEDGLKVKDADNIRIVHFAEQKDGEVKAEVLDSKENKVETTVNRKSEMTEASFDTEGFSVFAVAEVETVTEQTVTASGETVKVTVEVTDKNDVARLEKIRVNELSSDKDAYKDAFEAVVAAKEAEDKNFDKDRMGFFAADIELLDSNGEAFEPDGSVSVKMEFANLPKEASSQVSTMEVQHLAEKNGKVDVQTVAKGKDLEKINDVITADFSVDSFSTFALTWEEDSVIKEAKVHYGTIGTDGIFTDISEETSLDTNASSISLNSTMSGYTFVGAFYSEDATEKPSVDGQQIDHVLIKTDNGWKYTFDSEEGAVKENSHIYVTYKEKSGSVTPTPSTGNIPTPTTVKKVTDNGNGTYDVQLDIIGKQIAKEERKGANVLLIFDRTSSMTKPMANAPGDGQRIDAAKQAVHTLVNALNPGTNPVELAVFSFARFADPNANSQEGQIQGITWTENGQTITNFTDTVELAKSGSLGGYNGGTNWEAALDQAATYLATADSDPTYVIFLTDGNPSVDETNAGTYGHAPRDPVYANYTEYSRAQTAADNLLTAYPKVKFYGILCANQSEGPLLQTLVTHLSGDGYDATHILGDDSDTLNNSFKNIAQYIVDHLGASDVSTNDGITSLSHVSATVSGAAGAFRYYQAYKVTETNGVYTYLDDEGVKHEVPAAQVQTYTYKDADGHDQTYLYYNQTTWNTATGAAYNEATGVTWDLSSEKSLKEDRIYSVKFTIWPSQAAYDLLADLNNKIKVYEEGHTNSITAEERAQVYESGGVYYMKTNTNLDTTYSFDNHTYTDEIGFHQGAMDLDSEPIELKKIWPPNMLDSYGAAVYRDENGVEHTATEIVLTLVKDDADYLDVTLKKDEGWKKDNVYISCGVMTIEEDSEGNKVVDIKEPGHDYTVKEPKAFSYYWDLIADTYHPMVINHHTVMLILDEDATDDDVDNENYFKLNGKIYRKGDADTIELDASNYRRANLNITKVVTPNTAPADAEFEYTVTVHDADSTDGNVWFSAWDPTIGATVKDWDVTGAQAEIGADNKPTGYWYAPNGTEVTFSIKAGWNVRFLNLKHDSTFSIEETDEGDDFTFEKVEAAAQYKLMDGTDWADYEVDAKNNKLITGTITEPNNSYTVTYTNKWKTIDIQLKKVDEKGAALSGSSFDLTRREGTTWTNVKTDIKPGDTATQTSNPVDLGKLGVGHYRLEETNAPDGYNIISKFTYFEVYTDNDTLKARFTNEAGAPIDRPEGASIEVSGTAEAPVYTITITNPPGTPLPHTGGIGTTIFYVLGSILAVGCGIVLVSRRRMRNTKQ